MSSIKYRAKVLDKYGISVSTITFYGLELALFVYDRADRRCQKCGDKKNLTIHHLDHKGRNYENQGLEPNNDTDNLIVLCCKCHGSIHGKQGGRPKKLK